MRVCCVLTALCLLAGCLVARAAPRRGGMGEGTDARWIREFGNSDQSDIGDIATKALVQRILDRLQQRLLDGQLTDTNSWSTRGNQRQPDQEDEFLEETEVPNRSATKRKCLGRFQPYAMNC